MMQSDCLFCKIAMKKIPAKIVHEDDEILAFRDIQPQAPTHVLLIPKRHLTSIQDMHSEDCPLMGRLLFVAQSLATTEGIAEDGFRLVINTGTNGGQSVFHLHVHLLGGRSLTWPPG